MVGSCVLQRGNYSSHWESHEYSNHLRLCVCDSVCLHDKTKTSETKITKLGTGIDWHIDASPTNEY